MAALAELLEPIEREFKAPRREAVLTVPPEGLAKSMAALDAVRAEIENQRAYFEKAKSQLAEAPSPFLVAMLADELVGPHTAREAAAAKALASLSGKGQLNWDAPARELLLAAINVLKEAAEFHRNARWDLMAIAAPNRPDNDPLPPMTLGELRKRLASK